MKIIYKPGKPIKRITCPSCGVDHITGDEARITRALDWLQKKREGWTLREIAEGSGVTYETVRAYINKVK